MTGGQEGPATAGPSNLTMRKITQKVTYRVPHWNFCNDDTIVTGITPKATCRFCIKTRSGHRCALYDEELTTKGDSIYKVRACCKATAGFAVDVDPAPLPAPSPKELMKASIELYTSHVNELLKQGYPRPLAEKVAKKHVLGET